MSKEKVYWTTKDGREIAVDDMDEQHVRNTLKMILRNREYNDFDASIIDTF